MATAVEAIKATWAALKAGEIRKAWDAFNVVPNCPQCKGSGDPCGKFNEFVYWRGEVIEVCATCEGRGKFNTALL